MTNTAELQRLQVVIEAKTTQFQSQMSAFQKQMQSFAGKMEKSTSKLQNTAAKTGNAFSSMAKKMATVFAGVGVAAFAKQSISAAMTVESSMENISRIMGESANAFTQWAQTQAGSYGMAKEEAFKYGNVYSNLLNDFLSNTQETEQKTVQLMQASAVIASKTGRTMEDTMERIRSGLLGNTEAIEDLGIYANVAMLESTEAFKQFANGDSWDQLSFQTQQQIRLFAILEQANVKYGNSLAGTTATNQMRFLATLKNIRLNIGQAFLPIYNIVLPALNRLAVKIEAVTRTFAAFTQALFGKGKSTSQISSAGDSLSNATGSSGTVADNLKDASKNAKEMEKSLMSFDEINKLPDNSSSGGDTGGGSGGVDTGISGGTVQGVNDLANSFDGLSGKVAKFKEMLERLQKAAKPTTDALKRLWNEGLSKLGNFSIKALGSLWNDYLKPMGKWSLGEHGLARFFNITNSLLNEINWGKLLGSLKKFNEAMQKPTKFVFTGVLDFYEHFLKPVAKWTMNKALPTLLDTLTDFTNRVNWNKLNKAADELFKVLSKFATGIGEGLLDFLKGMTKLLTPALTGLINITADAFTGLFRALSLMPPSVLIGLGGALGGTLTAFVGYKALTGISAGIAAAVSRIQTAFWGLAAFVVSNPYLAIGAGIAALTGTIIALVTHAKETGEISEFQKKLEESTSKLNDMEKSMNNLIETRKKNSKGVADEYGTLEGYRNELQTIVDQNGKIKEGYEGRATFITGELSKALGTEINVVDGVVQKYADVNAEIKKQIELQKAQALLDENKAVYVNSTKQLKKYKTELASANTLYAEAKKKRDALQASYDAENAKLTEMRQNQQLGSYEYSQALQSQIDKTNSLGVELDSLNQDYGAQEQALRKAETAYSDCNATIVNYEGLTAAVVEGDTARIVQSTNDLVAGFHTAESGTQASLQNQMTNAKTYYEQLYKAHQEGSTAITKEMVDSAYADYQKSESQWRKRIELDSGMVVQLGNAVVAVQRDNGTKEQAVIGQNMSAIDGMYAGLPGSLSSTLSRNAHLVSAGASAVGNYVTGSMNNIFNNYQPSLLGVGVGEQFANGINSGVLNIKPAIQSSIHNLFRTGETFKMETSYATPGQPATKQKGTFGIRLFASGGFPEDGWFRASHGEYFGQFDDGSSYIANNNQITSGIAAGVQRANQENNALLRQQNRLLMQLLEKDTNVNISRSSLFNAVKDEAISYRNKTGQPAF